MTYVIEKIVPGCNTFVLREMTAAQAKETPHLIVTAARAHEWVRAGRVHETPLWLDDNRRIRRAQCCC